jgi:hypothetical protein
MKSLSVMLGVILIGLAVFTYAEVWGEEWEKYAENEKVICCYDVESLSQPSQNIIKVWVRFEYTEIGVTDPVLVKKFKKKVNQLDNSKSLYAINCVEKKYRILEFRLHSKEGKVLHMDSTPSNWKHIIRESLNDALYKAVCK